MIEGKRYRILLGMYLKAVVFLLLGVLARGWARGQTIHPVIVEYAAKADGRFEVTNDTFVPMAVVLEPESFSIAEDGRGVYRALDANIHVKLSTSSFRLEPKQTYYVFYKASADRLPAWFTVYAAFSPVGAGEGLRVRIMLPHTVYLYQKNAIQKEAIHFEKVLFSAQDGSIVCDLHNDGPALVRVQEVRAVAGNRSVLAPGFPLLPGSSRHLSIDWTEKGRPEYLLVQFPHFEIKEPLAISGP